MRRHYTGIMNALYVFAVLCFATAQLPDWRNSIIACGVGAGIYCLIMAVNLLSRMAAGLDD